jgi:protein-L-isoaspartate(D-aspartate) O-methyltransferase
MKRVSSVTHEDDVSALRQLMVDQLKRSNMVFAPRVEAAFRAVPRHLFLPTIPPERAYQNEAIVTKQLDGVSVSSSTQPSAMAIMLEQLELEPGHNVLEIGAATGYNSALMSHIVGKTGSVTTMDIDEDLVAQARENLRRAGFDQVRVICADGGYGYPDAAPYDRIILTVGAWDIAPAWTEQLKENGRLLLPLSLLKDGPIRNSPQKTIAFQPSDGHLSSVSMSDCGFMLLRGAFAEPENRTLQIGPEPGLKLELKFNNPLSLSPSAIYESLNGAHKDWPTGIEITGPSLWLKLLPWLSLRMPDLCLLHAEGRLATRGLVPYLFGLSGKFCSTGGLLGDESLALLMRPPGHSLPKESSPDQTPFELFVRSFGADETPAHLLLEEVREWEAAARPPWDHKLRVRVYPKESDYQHSANELISERKWNRFVIDWS